MKHSLRNFIAGGVVAASLLGGGAVASAATSTSTPTESSSTASTQRVEPTAAERAAHKAERTAALAKALGVSTDQVTAAQKAAQIGRAHV